MSKLLPCGFSHCILLLIACGAGKASFAQQDIASVDDFNPLLLQGGRQKALDLSRFQRANLPAAGTYRVELIANDVWSGMIDLRIQTDSSTKNQRICIEQSMLSKANAAPDKLDAELWRKIADSQQCVTLAELIPAGSERLDLSELRYRISIPQSVQQTSRRGYVDPSLWDHGINAMLLNYYFNHFRVDSGRQNIDSTFLGLDAGVNWGVWQFRHKGAWNQVVSSEGNRQNQWRQSANYLQRNFSDIAAKLTVGDFSTQGDLFDPLRMRGVQLQKDLRMLPASMRGYAPVIRGVADSNAKVSVRQRGVLIYETSVTPGPFELSDLYETSGGGDLDVLITESDGRQKKLTVPYAYIPQLLRENVSLFQIAVGQVRNQGARYSPLLAQFTYQHGWNDVLSLYGGLSLSSVNQSTLAGLALNTGIGAWGGDLTYARSSLPSSEQQTGYSLRVSYSLTVPNTDTSIALAAYRYSSRRFLSQNDAVLLNDPFVQSDLGAVYRNQRRLSISLNQRLGANSGLLFVTGTSTNYWDRQNGDLQYQIGYSNHYKQWSYSLSLTRTKDSFSGRHFNQWYAGFSLPLESSFGSAPLLTASSSYGSDGSRSNLVNYSATTGDESQWTYAANLAKDAVNTNVGVAAEYRGSKGKAGATLSTSSIYRQASISAAGSVLGHENGIVFGQSIGDTVGLVDAADAGGARVTNSNGVKVDTNGFAIVPYLTPYARNTVELSPRGLPVGLQMDSSTQEIAPYAGAIVKLKFTSSLKPMYLLEVTRNNGEPLPFGAQIFDPDGKELAFTGQGGRIFVSLIKQNSWLEARWSEDGGQETCRISYQLIPKKSPRLDSPFETLHLVCEAARDPGNAISRSE